MDWLDVLKEGSKGIFWGFVGLTLWALFLWLTISITTIVSKKNERLGKLLEAVIIIVWLVVLPLALVEYFGE